MSKLTKQNVGGIDYTMVGCTLTGVCASGAADYIKVVTLSDGDAIGDGMTIVVAFTNGNTAGTAPLPTTVYSSDQVDYYEDDQLTVPFTLAPEGCYEIEYTGEGNAYHYVSYPIMQIGSVSGPLCDASGNKASGALWLAGDKVSVNYSSGCFNVIPQATDSMTVMTASSVVNGAPLRAGSTVRVMFTADLAGTDTITGLVLSYNGVNTPVRVGKNGSLSDFVASEVSTGVYKYVQAYTTLELAFDGVQFIIIGNTVVLSSTDYTIYADGTINYTPINNITNNSKPIMASAVFNLDTFPLTKFIVNVGFDANIYPAHSSVTIQDLINFLKQKRFIETKSLLTGYNGVHLTLNFVNSTASQWYFNSIGLRSAWIEFEGAFISLDSTESEERWIMKIHTVETKAEYIGFKLPSSNPVVLKTTLTNI